MHGIQDGVVTHLVRQAVRFAVPGRGPSRTAAAVRSLCRSVAERQGQRLIAHVPTQGQSTQPSLSGPSGFIGSVRPRLRIRRAGVYPKSLQMVVGSSILVVFFCSHSSESECFLPHGYHRTVRSPPSTWELLFRKRTLRHFANWPDSSLSFRLLFLLSAGWERNLGREIVSYLLPHELACWTLEPSIQQSHTLATTTTTATALARSSFVVDESTGHSATTQVNHVVYFSTIPHREGQRIDLSFGARCGSSLSPHLPCSCLWGASSGRRPKHRKFVAVCANRISNIIHICMNSILLARNSNA